ncbi:MAG: T9SS type A sorting domain-containing protein [Cyclobacteriaceae bacterium]
MKKHYLFIGLLVASLMVNAQTFRTYSGGAWDGPPPSSGDVLIFDDNFTLDGDYNAGGVSVTEGNTLTVPTGNTLEIDGGTVSLQGTDIWPASAGLEPSNQSNYHLVVDVVWGNSTTDVVNGTGSMTIDFGDNLPYTNGAYVANRDNPDASLTGGNVYTCSFWAKASRDQSALKVDVAEAGGWGGDINTQTIVSLSTTWKRYSFSVTPANTANYFVMLIVADNASGSQDGSNATVISVDDLRLEDATTPANTASLTVNSGGSLITHAADGAAPWATIKRNKSFSDERYSFVGSPVAAPSILGADLGTHAYSYDESVAYGADGLARWTNALGSSITVGHGYAAAGGFQELVFSGVPNSGDVVVDGLTVSGGDESGWALISNPYPAALNVESVIAGMTNTTGSVYLWDDNGSNTSRGSNSDYISVNTLGSTGGSQAGTFNGYIGSAQGFFVQLNSGTSVTFAESMRASGNNADANFFRKGDQTPDGNLRLSLASLDGSFYSDLLIGLRTEATIGVDRGLDAARLGESEELGFYSFIDDSKFTIQGLPLEVGVSTELGFDLNTAQTLKLSVEELGELPTGQTFLLHDAVTGITYNLSETPSFEFSSEAGSNQNRFTLSFGSANVLTNSLVSNQPIYRYTNQVMSVDFASNLDVVEFAVYDLSGRALFKNNTFSSDIQSLKVPMNAKGINILRIVTSEGTFTRKFNF